eukprot:TRINITY_DN3597_c0_g1_i1.p1 TRINITY_DN3597_c0_g1~~TRINITY_DN3597_c0_g1_i1.p1  ORF type:complete len:512 (-),score=50.87 TRINITY_DN3597_c0_g1_i1:232-1767(-)
MDRLFASRFTGYQSQQQQQQQQPSLTCFGSNNDAEDDLNAAQFSYNQILPISRHGKAVTGGTQGGFSSKCNNTVMGGDEEEEFSMRQLQYQFLPFKEMMSDSFSKSRAGSSRSSIEPVLAPQNLPDFSTIDSAGYSERWASEMLLECARAIAHKDSSRVQQLLWMLNELSSPYGDCDQKLASYFLQAFFCKITDTGPRCYRTLCAAVEKTYSFDSSRKMILKFQECSPWTTFGHVAANGAILEAFDGETNLHIIDLSSTFCTQWPTLLESLATRSDETPHLRLTTVLMGSPESSSCNKVMQEIGHRMQKFARLMGVPFEFRVLSSNSGLNPENLQVRPGEALAINCVQSLHQLPTNSRDSVLSVFHDMNPKILTITEDEFDLTSDDFYGRVNECLRFFSLYFDSLEDNFPRTSNERLMLERTSARSLVNILACSDVETVEETREKAARWASRLKYVGFVNAAFSDDVVDDVRALLKRYKEGWSHVSDSDAEGLFLTWKDQPVIWASAWKPD